MRFFPVFALLLFPLAPLAGSQDPEKSIAPPAMIFELLALNKDLSTTARPTYLSPSDIVASLDGKYLYVAEQTAKQIAVVDIATKAVIKTIKLPNEPTGIAVAPNGLLYVTCSSDLWPSGMVCEVHPGQGKVLRSLPAGNGARSPVVSPVENTLFVCNVFDNDVSVVDITNAKELKRIKAVREPYCAAITPDGSTLVVGNALPDQKSTDTLFVASKITLINAFSREKIVDAALPNGSKAVSDIAISPDGNYAFATHIIALFGTPFTRGCGCALTDNCAIIDIKKREILNDVALDRPLAGSANPWGIACTKDGKIVCITHAGSSELTMIDMKQLITIADTNPYYPAGILPQEMKVLLSHDFSALQDISWKSAVTGKSPRALAIIGNKAYTAGYFADKVEIFDLDPAGYVADTVKISNPGSDSAAAASGVIPLGPDPAQTSERKGECAFYDAGLSFQKWESCNTCHPLTRSDGIGWTLRGEYAAPKKSKSMLNSWWTPPTNWAGTRANAWESIRAGMNNELFLDPDMTIAAYMDTLLMKLKPVSSPYLVKGRLSASAARGREIFRGSKAACFACHSGPLYTDTKFHASIIPDQYDANAKWDTPSLVECWRTAPYGHLGSMSTIQEMLGLSGMGDVSAKLTQDELNDLAEFVLSL